MKKNCSSSLTLRGRKFYYKITDFRHTVQRDLTATAWGSFDCVICMSEYINGIVVIDISKWANCKYIYLLSMIFFFHIEKERLSLLW